MSSLLWLVLYDVDADHSHSLDVALLLIHFGAAAVLAAGRRLGGFQAFAGAILADDAGSASATLGFISRCGKLHGFYAQGLVNGLDWHENGVSCLCLWPFFAKLRHCVQFILRWDLLACRHHALEPRGWQPGLGTESFLQHLHE